MTSNLVRIANGIAMALGHGHALDDEEMSGISSLRQLQDAWRVTGEARNAENPHGPDGMVGWKEITKEGDAGEELLTDLMHVTSSGRLCIFVSDDGLNRHIALVFNAGPLTPDGEPRQVAYLSFHPDLLDDPKADLKLEVNPALLVDRPVGEKPVDRCDRLSLLHKIDRQLGGTIFRALEARTGEGYPDDVRVMATHMLAVMIQLGVYAQPPLPETNDIASLMRDAISNGGIYTP